MSRFKNIEQALLLSFRSLNLGVPTGYPNKRLGAGEKGSGLWIDITNARGESEPVTIGPNGQNNHPGFLQIDIHAQNDTGAGAALDVADILSDHFTAGKPVSYNEQIVVIRGSSVRTGRYVGGDYVITVDVFYYARTNRNLNI